MSDTPTLRAFHMALNVIMRRHGGRGPACDGPACGVCRELEALLSPAEARDWQLIETAPKDGTDVLLAAPDEMGGWKQGEGCFAHGILWNWRWAHKPTHWMPLPDPPAEARVPSERPHEKNEDDLGLLGNTATKGL